MQQCMPRGGQGAAGERNRIMTDVEESRGPAATAADFAQRNAPHDGGDSVAADLFGNATQSFKDKARGVAEEQKSAGAERIGAFGKAVHGAADELRKEAPSAARYIHSAAEQIEGVASRLQNRSIDDLLSRVNRYARRQPAAAFAGSVVVGFALSRFLKSSGR
jgi:hypothetical protein